MNSQKYITNLGDDIELLDMMLIDLKDQSTIYRAGPYWLKKSKITTNEIKRYGIADFRGSSNLIGLSYTDSLHVDYRNIYNHGLRRLATWITKIYPLSNLYKSQVQWTESYAKSNINYAQEILNLKERTKYIIKNYKIPYSLAGNCLQMATIDGHDYSIHYLNLLDEHDNFASRINFNAAKEIFEIGGGFGANIHLLLENYKNIKKVLYLDIPPNLYVGTQYLKAFYKTAVHDYRALKRCDIIKFKEDDSLEIFCIAPWQIENFKGKIDILTNQNSFVETPEGSIKNYANIFNTFDKSSNAAIALATYDSFDQKTIHPNNLPMFFKNRKFDHFEMDRLDSSKKNLYFVSPGNFSL